MICSLAYWLGRGTCMPAKAPKWRPEDNLWDSVLPFHHLSETSGSNSGRQAWWQTSLLDELSHQSDIILDLMMVSWVNIHVIFFKGGQVWRNVCVSNPSTQEAEGRRIPSLKSAWGTCKRLFQNQKQKEDKKKVCQIYGFRVWLTNVKLF